MVLLTYEPLLYRSNVKDLNSLTTTYLTEIKSELTSILRPTYPDSTNKDNLIRKVELLTKLGINNIDFYLLDTMRASDLENIKSFLF